MEKIIFVFLSVFLISCTSERVSLDNFDVDSVHKKRIEYFLDVISKEDIEKVKDIVNENKININVVDKSGKTLILLSLLNEKDSLTKLLLRLSADPNAMKAAYKKKSIMGWAASYKNETFLELLLHNGGDPNLIANGEWPASTPIFDAIRVNNIKNMELLIRSGADLNIEDRGGFTPIMLAAATGKWEILHILLESGSDYNYVNKHGKNVVTFIEIQGLGISGEEGQWRKKVFAYLKERKLNLKPRVPL